MKKLSLPAWLFAAGLVAGIALASSCRFYNLERRLSPVQADFVSKTQYIMTKGERKIFLELPESERAGFIADFWKKRDPDPETEPNEYKREYEDRVEQSGKLFSGEGRPGWLTDRGRIFILFGPPMERMTYPMDASGFCREVWYYGSFPVIFIDEHCSGNYVLTAINLEHLQELNIAQGHFQRSIRPEEKKTFDYKVSIQKVRAEAELFEGRVWIDVPYAAIWFSLQKGRLETSFDVRLEMRDESKKLVWEYKEVFPLSMTEDELKENREKTFRIDVPFVLDKDMAGLWEQKLKLQLVIKSSTGGGDLKKVLEFRLKS